MILNKSKIMIIFIIIFLGASAVSGVTISQDNYQESKNNVSILYSGEILDQSLDGWSTSSTSWWFDTQYNAQGFKPTVNKITKLGVPLRRTSGTSGLNFYISLYDDNNGKPGSFLKGGAQPYNTLTTSMAWYYYDFSSSPVDVTPGEQYYVLVRLQGGDLPDGEEIFWHSQWSFPPWDPYPNGDPWTSADSGSTWTNNGDGTHGVYGDLGFRVYGLFDSNQPTVDITSPSNGQTVSGTISIQGTASDSDGSVTQVQYKIDSTSWVTASGTTSWSASWDTNTVSDGSHTIYARSKDNDNQYSSEDTVAINVNNGGGTNSPPTCSLSASPTSGEPPLSVSFSMGASDSDGSIASWSLNIDNSGSAEYSGSGAPPSTRSHTYNSYGTFTAKLTVTDNKGATGTATKTISVIDLNDPPNAVIKAIDSTGDGVETTFDASSSSDPDGSIVGYRWDWTNDGTWDTGWLSTSKKTHTYSSTGTKTVKLEVKDNKGKTDTDTEDFTVKELIVKVVKLDATGDITIDGVPSSTPIWKITVNSNILIEDHPIFDHFNKGAGGIFNIKATLEDNIGVTWTPKVEYSYSLDAAKDNKVINPEIDKINNGDFSFDVNVPNKVGKYTLSLDIIIKDNLDDKVWTYTINRDVYIAYDNSLLSLPKLLWIQSATNWADGKSTLGDISSTLLHEIYDTNWAYGPNDYHDWQDVLTLHEGNCLSYAHLWKNMNKVLGIDKGTRSIYTSYEVKDKSGYVVGSNPRCGYKTNDLECLDGEKKEWDFTYHQVGYSNVHDPTFNIQKSLENYEKDLIKEWSQTFTGPCGDSITVTISGSDLEPLIENKEVSTTFDLCSETYTLHVYMQDGSSDFSDPVINANIKPADNSIIETDKFSYEINEPIIIKSYTSYNGKIVKELNVNATIEKPDGTSSKLALYDDGNNGDEASNDGIFTGIYSDTSIEGGYKISAEAKGQYEHYQINREAIVTNGVIVQEIGAKFSTGILDYGVDTDSNNLYNLLQLHIPLEIEDAGQYSILGLLKDDDEIILSSSKSEYLSSGSNFIDLNFINVDRLRALELSGPYTIELTLYNNDFGEINAIEYMTFPYDYLDFEKPVVELIETFSDYGIDSDINGLYNYLNIEINIQVDYAGYYTITGILSNNQDSDIFSTKTIYLDVGMNLIELEFNGSKIYNNGVDGPYNLVILSIYNENDLLIDTLSDCYTTNYYSYLDFELPFTSPPNIPLTPNGESEGVINIEYTFTTSTTDPDNDNIQYGWDFNGDEIIDKWTGFYESGDTCSVDYKWNDYGYYQIKVKAFDVYNIGSSWSDSWTIYLTSPPEANFIYYPENPTDIDDIEFLDLSIDIDGEIVDWFWDFGDGYTSSSQNPTHQFSDDGIYRVELIVWDDFGVVDNIIRFIEILNVPPIADPNGPYFTEETNVIEFDGSASHDLDGTIVSYEWDFGDGETETGPHPRHSYQEPGNYTVTLTVTDDDGATNTTATWAESFNDPPIITLYYPTDDEIVSGKITIEWFAAEGAFPEEGEYIYIYYKPENADSYRKISDDMPLPNTGEYEWDTSTLGDGEYTLLVEAMDQHGNIAYDSCTFTVDNNYAGIRVSDVDIKDTSIESSSYVKDGDSVEITAGITGSISLSKDDISADLSGFGRGTVIAESYDGFIATWTLDNVECTPSDGQIEVTVYAGDLDSNTGTITADNTAPELVIEKPTSGFWFYNNKLLPMKNTFILGPIEIQVSGSSDIKNVEFYLDDELMVTDNEPNFEWYMNKKLMGKHQLEITVYDQAGNIKEASQSITVYNIFGN